MLSKEDVAKICDCKACPFSKDGGPGALVLAENASVTAALPAGTTNALLVGEYPGDDDAREGKPFRGMTGKELDWKLANAGLARHKCTLVNAVGCKPVGPKTDNAIGRAAKCCLPLYQEQTRAHKSKPTLAMGKWAAYAVTGKASGVEHSRGFVRENVIITYAAQYAFFKNRWVKGDFEIDLLRFKRMATGSLQAAPTVVCEPTTGDMETLRRSIQANNNTVAVDIETAPEDGDPTGTTGKDPTRARLKTIAFGTAEFAVAMQWPSHNGVWSAAQDILSSIDITKVLHNGHYFDLRILKRYGIVVTNVKDTREIRRALVSTSGLALRYLAQTYVDFPAWKELEDEK